MAPINSAQKDLEEYEAHHEENESQTAEQQKKSVIIDGIEPIHVNTRLANTVWIIKGKSKVFFENDEVSAVICDNASVECRGERNIITTTGNSSLIVLRDPFLKLYVEDHSFAIVYGSGKVHCKDNSNVQAYGSFSITARHSCRIQCYGCSKVEVYGCGSLDAFGLSRIFVNGSLATMGFSGTTPPVVLHNECTIGFKNYCFDHPVCRLLDASRFMDEEEDDFILDEHDSSSEIKEKEPEVWTDLIQLRRHYFPLTYRVTRKSRNISKSRITDVLSEFAKRLQQEFEFQESIPPVDDIE